jgi:hypothetical protein
MIWEYQAVVICMVETGQESTRTHSASSCSSAHSLACDKAPYCRAMSGLLQMWTCQITNSEFVRLEQPIGCSHERRSTVITETALNACHFLLKMQQPMCCAYVQDREDHPVGDAFDAVAITLCQFVRNEMRSEGTLQ